MEGFRRSGQCNKTDGPWSGFIYTEILRERFLKICIREREGESVYACVYKCVRMHIQICGGGGGCVRLRTDLKLG